MTVVDASVWIARLVPGDVHHASSRAWLERHVAAGGLVAAPVLLLAEIAGAISRRTGDATLGHRAVTAVLAVPTLRLVPIDQTLASVAAQLAADLGLRGADAMYAATAVELNVQLVTWDQDQLLRAGRRISATSP